MRRLEFAQQGAPLGSAPDHLGAGGERCGFRPITECTAPISSVSRPAVINQVFSHMLSLSADGACSSAAMQRQADGLCRLERDVQQRRGGSAYSRAIPGGSAAAASRPARPFPAGRSAAPMQTRGPAPNGIQARPSGIGGCAVHEALGPEPVRLRKQVFVAGAGSTASAAASRLAESASPPSVMGAVVRRLISTGAGGYRRRASFKVACSQGRRAMSSAEGRWAPPSTVSTLVGGPLCG